MIRMVALVIAVGLSVVGYSVGERVGAKREAAKEFAIEVDFWFAEAGSTVVDTVHYYGYERRNRCGELVTVPADTVYSDRQTWDEIASGSRLFSKESMRANGDDRWYSERSSHKLWLRARPVTTHRENVTKIVRRPLW